LEGDGEGRDQHTLFCKGNLHVQSGRVGGEWGGGGGGGVLIRTKTLSVKETNTKKGGEKKKKRKLILKPERNRPRGQPPVLEVGRRSRGNASKK